MLALLVSILACVLFMVCNFKSCFNNHTSPQNIKLDPIDQEYQKNKHIKVRAMVTYFLRKKMYSGHCLNFDYQMLERYYMKTTGIPSLEKLYHSTSYTSPNYCPFPSESHYAVGKCVHGNARDEAQEAGFLICFPGSSVANLVLKTITVGIKLALTKTLLISRGNEDSHSLNLQLLFLCPTNSLT